jgi:hypothetical protein
VDPRAGLDPHRDLNPDPSVVQPVASRYTDYAIPAPSTLSVHIIKRFPRSFFKNATSTRNVHLTLHSVPAAVVQLHNTTPANPRENDMTKILNHTLISAVQRRFTMKTVIFWDLTPCSMLEMRNV